MVNFFIGIILLFTTVYGENNCHAGGAGYNLALHRQTDVAVFPLKRFNISNFTIDFWMRDLSSSYKSTPFALMTSDNISFAWTVFDKISCFGQTFNAHIPFNNAQKHINMWNHIAFSVEHEENITHCTLFVNGTEIYSVSPTNVQINESYDLYLSIGQSQTSYKTIGWPENSFQGYIDNLRLWSASLDVENISSLINLDLNLTSPFLVSFWSFNTIDKMNKSRIIDDLCRHDGVYGSVERNEILLSDSTEATYGFSDAPIITEGVPTYIGITENETEISIKYSNDSICEASISLFPVEGILLDADRIELNPTNPNVTTKIIYSSRTHIINPDFFEYTLRIDGHESTGRFYLIFLSEIIDKPNPFNKSMKVYPKTTTPIPLECKSLNGEKNYPIVTRIPSLGVLYQIVESDQGKLMDFEPIFYNNSIVTSPRKVVAYTSPTISENSDEIWYTCATGSLLSNEIAKVDIQIQSVETQSLLGTIRYGLYFNGFRSYSFSSIYPKHLRSASLYVKISEHPYLNNTKMPIISGYYYNEMNEDVYFEFFAFKSTHHYYYIGFLTRYKGVELYVYSNSNEYIVINEKWTYVGFSFTTSNSLSLTINGFQVGQGTVHSNNIFGMILFGKNDNSYLRGSITNIQLWSISFPPSILYQYSIGQLSGNESGLLAYWNLNEGEGSLSYDKSQNGIDLMLNEDITFRPAWIIVDDLNFNVIRLLLNESITIQLESHRDISQVNKSTYIITSIPKKGNLFQYPSKEPIGRIPGADDTMSYDFSNITLISEWVSKADNYSSYRMQGKTNFYSPANLIGAPQYFTEKFSSAVESHGDHTYAWSPLIDCSVQRYEYIDFSIEKSLYILDMDIFENYNPGSVKMIFSYDEKSSDWKLLYKKNIVVPTTPLYTVFKPPICNVNTFRSKKYRIVLDVCAYPGDKGIEAVRIYGTEELNSNIVADPQGRVIYEMNREFTNTDDDSFSYTALDCRLPSNSFIPSFTFSVKPYTIGFGPISLAAESTLTENHDIILKLNSHKTNPIDNSSLQHIITLLPTKGILYEYNNTEREIDYLVKDRDGNVLFRPDKNSCGLNYTNFTFAASDSTQMSSSAIFSLHVICRPNYHIVPNPAFYLVYALITLQILMAISLLIYFLFVQLIKGKRLNNHPVFISVHVAGSCIGYFYLYFWLMTPSNTLCHLRIWFYHICLSTSAAALFVHVYSEWKSFTIKALRSGKKVSVKSHHILLVIILVIDIAQLITFSLVNRPISVIQPYGDNTAFRVSTCVMKNYSENYLFLLKGLVLMIALIICIILFSWSPYTSVQMRLLMAIIIIIIIVGTVGTILIALVNNFIVIFIAQFLTLSIILSMSLLATFSLNLKDFVESKDNSDKDASYSIDMTQKMNNHSDDKSVLELLDTIEKKEKELVTIKKRVLRKESKIRQLEQKIISYENLE